MEENYRFQPHHEGRLGGGTSLLKSQSSGRNGDVLRRPPLGNRSINNSISKDDGEPVSIIHTNDNSWYQNNHHLHHPNEKWNSLTATTLSRSEGQSFGGGNGQKRHHRETMSSSSSSTTAIGTIMGEARTKIDCMSTPSTNRSNGINQHYNNMSSVGSMRPNDGCGYDGQSVLHHNSGVNANDQMMVTTAYSTVRTPLPNTRTSSSYYQNYQQQHPTAVGGGTFMASEYGTEASYDVHNLAPRPPPSPIETVSRNRIIPTGSLGHGPGRGGAPFKSPITLCFERMLGAGTFVVDVFVFPAVKSL
jgi:hypothetical protein